MTEATVGREPIQIVELNLPQCANEYGCGLCTAGLGSVDADSGLSEYFPTGVSKVGAYSSVSDATRGWDRDGLTLTATGANPRIYESGATGFDGDDFRYIVVWGKCITPGAPLFTAWYGTVDADRSMQAVNFSQRYRGATLETIKAGQEFVAVFDAADSVNYATDWQGNTVTGLQFGFSDDVGSEYLLYSIQVCESDLFAARGSECFKTYATCGDLDNYRERLTPVNSPLGTYSTGADIPAGDLSVSGDAIFWARVNLPLEPEGVIFAAGSATNYIYMGFDGGDLQWSAGGNTTTTRIRNATPYDISGFLGKTVDFVFEIYASQDQAAVYISEPISGASEYIGVLLIPSSGSFPSGQWSAATSGQVGSDGGNTYGSEVGGDFNGSVKFVYYYSDQLMITREGEAYLSKMHIGRPQQAVPRDDLRILPMLRSANAVAANINIGTFDRNFSPLGSRASSTVSFSDAVGTDRGIDPYYSDRDYDVTDGTRGLFWERFRPRQKVGLYGSTVNIYDGYAGQYLSEMMQRSYIADEVTWSNGDVMSLRSRDVLTRADLANAQYPAVSVGQLSGDINDIVLALDTTGHILSDYPASGTVRIGDELITYSAIVDNLDNTFTWTLTARGTDGTTADSHSDEDTVQKCERFTDATIYECLERIFGDGTSIPYQYMDLSGWEAVSSGDLPTYGLSRVISVPSSPSVLAGELARDCGFYIWWDERVSLIKIKAIKSEVDAPTALSDDNDILAGTVSYKEKPSERMSSLYIAYNPHDPTDLGTSDTTDDLTKYANVSLTIVNEGYKEELTKVIYSPWLTASADVFQTQSRLTRLYSEIPVQITFQLDAKGRDLWLGDVVRITNNRMRDQFGVPDARLYVITSANEVSSGEIVQYTAQDTTIFGQTYVVAPAGHGDYTGDPSIDLNYGFISLPGGLMPDGKRGPTIS